MGSPEKSRPNPHWKRAISKEDVSLGEGKIPRTENHFHLPSLEEEESEDFYREKARPLVKFREDVLNHVVVGDYFCYVRELRKRYENDFLCIVGTNIFTVRKANSLDEEDDGYNILFHYEGNFALNTKPASQTEASEKFDKFLKNFKPSALVDFGILVIDLVIIRRWAFVLEDSEDHEENVMAWRKNYVSLLSTVNRLWYNSLSPWIKKPTFILVMDSHEDNHFANLDAATIGSGKNETEEDECV